MQMTRSSSRVAIGDDAAELAGLSRESLAKRWRTRFGHEPPRGCGRTFLELAEAYALQTAAFGFLKPGLRRQIEGETQSSGKRRAARMSKNVSHLTPGTRLVREWNGRTYHADVSVAGFVWNGRTWPSRLDSNSMVLISPPSITTMRSHFPCDAGVSKQSLSSVLRRLVRYLSTPFWLMQSRKATTGSNSFPPDSRNPRPRLRRVPGLTMAK